MATERISSGTYLLFVLVTRITESNIMFLQNRLTLISSLLNSRINQVQGPN